MAEVLRWSLRLRASGPQKPRRFQCCYESSTTGALVRRLKPNAPPWGNDVVLTRRQTANVLNIHQDSVTRALPDGLGAAVVSWGGNGKEMTFSRAMLERWEHARTCRRRGGDKCFTCWMVMEDSLAVAAHLIEARHGVWESCNDDCGYPAEICLPCVP